jgi:polyisoprenoid-binding protein YceI
MNKIKLISGSIAIIVSLASYAQVPEKFISSKSHIKFYSTTPVEDIEANNYASISTLIPESGKVVFSVPMQSFEFEKALMQQHFNNEHFLETNVYPKSKLTGRILNLENIDFTKKGEYDAEIEGELTIKGITKPLKEKGTISIEDNRVKVYSKFNLTLANYGITFDATELVSTKIAKEVEVTVNAEYYPE